ncbi:MarR family winged helix-turn-helix transcriptional regulator [Cellulosimicrobium marinum]|uniref:MarR family winged helix-turn-helix transcriptional regulator n=1 Tax=Cellulosimicrobium marinum TaxID=1638992 RepID=UPI001E61D1D0|nr:MarR family winged helix-turn-helix transcriptional regulator [Cellulosimicrobium marinum]MCB7137085.1 MarR family winged helix-turn-helix transcriptional regulator [Cellulosimicrobium marinum]
MGAHEDEGRGPGVQAERLSLVEQVDDAGQVLGETFLAQRLEPILTMPLTVQQLRALAVLQLDGPAGAHHLADVLGVSGATVTGIVDRLVAAGMAERHADPSDGRVRVVAATARGADAVRRLAAREEPTQHLLERLDLDDLRALARGIAALARAAREDADGA